MSLNLSTQSEKLAEAKAKLKAAQAEADEENNKKALAVGRAVMDEAKRNAAFQNQLVEILGRRIKGKRLRLALGLDEEKQAESVPAPGLSESAASSPPSFAASSHEASG